MPASLVPPVLHKWRTLVWPTGDRSKAIRSLVFNLAIIVAFGVVVPWMRGLDFFDPFLLLAYTAIPLLFAASAVTELAAGGMRDSAPASILASALHASAVFAVILALGIATVNFAIHQTRLLHPNWSLASGVLLLSFSGSLLLAACGAVLTVIFSASAARNTIRTLFLFILLGILYGPRYLPAMWQAEIDAQMTTEGLTRVACIGAAVAGVLALGLILSLRKGRETQPVN